jgi:hypothetical protein
VQVRSAGACQHVYEYQISTANRGIDLAHQVVWPHQHKRSVHAGNEGQKRVTRHSCACACTSAVHMLLGAVAVVVHAIFSLANRTW